jgi:hypothetical protein
MKRKGWKPRTCLYEILWEEEEEDEKWWNLRKERET